MLDKFEVELILWFIGDTIIWSGVYFLCAKSHIRKAEKNGTEADLKGLRISFILLWLVLHLLFVWAGIELVKWGGPD